MRRRAGFAPLPMLFVILLAACGSDSGGSAEPASGADIYATSCATCHADDGGGFVGPSLVGVHDRLSGDEIVAVIANGRSGTGGQMPPWAGRYSPDEIEAVSEYLRTFG